MDKPLEILAQHRDALLLAEVGAWLHNLGKLSEEFVLSQFAVAGNIKYEDYRSFKYEHVVGIVADLYTTNGRVTGSAQNRLKDKLGTWDISKTLGFLLDGHPALANWLTQIKIKLPPPLDDREYMVGELIEFQDYGWYKDSGKGNPPLISLLFPSPQSSRATELVEASHHAASGAEKGNTQAKQSQYPLFGATAFGYEYVIDIEQLADYRNLLSTEIISGKRSELLKNGQIWMSRALADTRRPLNDVSLWDISSAVAAFYKASAARFILEKSWLPSGVLEAHDTLTWRILRIAIDGLTFYGQSPRMIDLKSRQLALQATLDTVRTLLEETYPISNEIYRDENGSAFVVPDFTDEDQDGNQIKDLLQARIDQCFNPDLNKEERQQNFRTMVLGEIMPRITISEAHKQARMLSEELQRDVPPAQANYDMVNKAWFESRISNSQEVCTVCQLRPQKDIRSKEDNKYNKRKVCEICEQRRNDRVKDWNKDARRETIWIDEVADQYGRLALVVGQFGLEDWLNGKLIETLTVNDPKVKYEPKNPSFARIRRVWETTRKFWEEIQEGFETSVGRVGSRLKITGQFSGDGEGLKLYHAYELKLGPVRFSIVCVGKKGKELEFISAENLERAALLLGEKLERKEAAEFIQNRLESPSEAGFEIEESTGYGSPNKLRGSLQITAVTPEPDNYLPVIPILAEPRTFMALVPADKSLEVVKAIQEKYEREMGKVRNRLPLTVGVVYAGARTPLPAILDAGRRMLKQPTKAQCWQVKKDVHDQNNPWPEEVEVKLHRDEQILKLKVPVKMGDKATEDVWYPYWKVEKDKEGNQPAGRKRQFLGADAKQWIHICDLKEGDKVELMPSRFDFEWLDTAARRFEISYDESKRRTPSNDDWKHGDSKPRPYYLEQVKELDEIWQIVAESLSSSQIKALVPLISTMRVEWQGDAEVVKQLIKAAVANLQWRRDKEGKSRKPDAGKLALLEQAAISGQLADVVELHMEILKDKPEANQDDKQETIS